MVFRLAAFTACVFAAPLAGQTPLSRADVIRTALERGPRVAVARADTSVAAAALMSARIRPNPGFNASYSKSVPNFHYNVDVPLDLPVVRRLRIRAAELGLEAAQIKLLFARAMLAMEADTAYTRAVAARERSALSRRNALDADSLLHMVERRRDAGDASEMDVALARVNAGQQENVAAADSLTHISTLLDLQNILGLSSGRLEVQVTDSLGQTPAAATPVATTLDVVAAQRTVEGASLNAQLQRRSIWSGLSVALGFEHGDPGQPGILPTFGLGIGLPLFDRNRGAIAVAEAEREKARAELTLAEVESRNAVALALRERENALSKVARDRLLLDGANRVTAMSLTAYREGAASLGNVLEAQRTARDVLGQYIDDLTAAWIATAELRVFSLSIGSSVP